jgi:hypothetical protein
MWLLEKKMEPSASYLSAKDISQTASRKDWKNTDVIVLWFLLCILAMVANIVVWQCSLVPIFEFQHKGDFVSENKYIVLYHQEWVFMKCLLT